MKSKILNSKAYQVFDYICRLIMLNILLVVCSFSIFLIAINVFPDMSNIYQLLFLIPTAVTLFPSLLAVFAVIRDYVVKNATGIFKEYFYYFKKYFLKTILLSIGLILYALLISNSFTYFKNMLTSGAINLVGLLLTLSLGLMSIFTLINLPLVIIYFDDLKLMHYLKLSFIFAFKDLGTTIILTLIVALSIFLSFYLSIYLLLIAFSLPILIIVKLTKNKFIKISERNK